VKLAASHTGSAAASTRDVFIRIVSWPEGRLNERRDEPMRQMSIISPAIFFAKMTSGRAAGSPGRVASDSRTHGCTSWNGLLRPYLVASSSCLLDSIHPRQRELNIITARLHMTGSTWRKKEPTTKVLLARSRAGDRQFGIAQGQLA
jgi:hypothetical protein